MSVQTEVKYKDQAESLFQLTIRFKNTQSKIISTKIQFPEASDTQFETKPQKDNSFVFTGDGFSTGFANTLKIKLFATDENNKLNEFEDTIEMTSHTIKAQCTPNESQQIWQLKLSNVPKIVEQVFINVHGVQNNDQIYGYPYQGKKVKDVVQTEISIAKHNFFHGAYVAEVFAKKETFKFKLMEVNFQTYLPCPKPSFIQLSLDEINGRFSAMVFGVEAPSPITEISAKIWCDQSDATTVVCQRDNDNWTLQDAVKNHKSHQGQYTFLFFASDQRGCKFLIGKESAWSQSELREQQEQNDQEEAERELEEQQLQQQQEDKKTQQKLELDQKSLTEAKSEQKQEPLRSDSQTSTQSSIKAESEPQKVIKYENGASIEVKYKDQLQSVFQLIINFQSIPNKISLVKVQFPTVSSNMFDAKSQKDGSFIYTGHCFDVGLQMGIVKTKILVTDEKNLSYEYEQKVDIISHFIQITCSANETQSIWSLKLINVPHAAEKVLVDVYAVKKKEYVHGYQYEAKRMIGKVQAEIDIANHSYFYGQYAVEVYLLRKDNKYKLSELSFQTDIPVPVIKKIETHVDAYMGRFTAKLTGIEAPSPIVDVTARIWCQEDDAIEMGCEKDRGNYFLIDTVKNHSFHQGLYTFLYFISDKRGCKFLAGQDSVRSTPEIQQQVAKQEQQSTLDQTSKQEQNQNLQKEDMAAKSEEQDQSIHKIDLMQSMRKPAKPEEPVQQILQAKVEDKTSKLRVQNSADNEADCDAQPKPNSVIEQLKPADKVEEKVTPQPQQQQVQVVPEQVLQQQVQQQQLQKVANQQQNINLLQPQPEATNALRSGMEKLKFKLNNKEQEDVSSLQMCVQNLTERKSQLEQLLISQQQQQKEEAEKLIQQQKSSENTIQEQQTQLQNSTMKVQELQKENEELNQKLSAGKNAVGLLNEKNKLQEQVKELTKKVEYLDSELQKASKLLQQKDEQIYKLQNQLQEKADKQKTKNEQEGKIDENERNQLLRDQVKCLSQQVSKQDSELTLLKETIQKLESEQTHKDGVVVQVDSSVLNKYKQENYLLVKEKSELVQQINTKQLQFEQLQQQVQKNQKQFETQLQKLQSDLKQKEGDIANLQQLNMQVAGMIYKKKVGDSQNILKQVLNEQIKQLDEAKQFDFSGLKDKIENVEMQVEGLLAQLKGAQKKKQK